MTAEKDVRFSLGTRFTPVGKRYVCTVVDILRTYNNDNELVKVRYAAVHQFMGQPVVDEYIETTIARGLVR